MRNASTFRLVITFKPEYSYSAFKDEKNRSKLDRYSSLSSEYSDRQFKNSDLFKWLGSFMNKTLITTKVNYFQRAETIHIYHIKEVNSSKDSDSCIFALNIITGEIFINKESYKIFNHSTINPFQKFCDNFIYHFKHRKEFNSTGTKLKRASKQTLLSSMLKFDTVQDLQIYADSTLKDAGISKERIMSYIRNTKNRLNL